MKCANAFHWLGHFFLVVLHYRLGMHPCVETSLGRCESLLRHHYALGMEKRHLQASHTQTKNKSVFLSPVSYVFSSLHAAPILKYFIQRFNNTFRSTEQGGTNKQTGEQNNRMKTKVKTNRENSYQREHSWEFWPFILLRDKTYYDKIRVTQRLHHSASEECLSYSSWHMLFLFLF